MAEVKNRDAEVITLGSGDLMVKEYDATTGVPAYTEFSAETDLLGRIQGGATLEYKPTYYEAKDDTGIVSKTVRLMPNGRSKESMSFPTFDFIKLANQTWEESDLYQTLSSTKFMFVIFQSEYTENPEEMVQSLSVAGGINSNLAPSGVTGFKFKGIKFWNMPVEDLEEVHRVWDRTVNTIRQGVILTTTKHGVTNNLPKQSESRVAHVRPHGRNAADKLPLPDGRMMTKQCFWLNSNYIEKQIAKN